MAIRIAMNVICDRCIKPYEQKNLEYGEDVPEVLREKLVLRRESEPDPKTGEVKEVVLFEYNDLCPSCRKVVDKAIQKLKMEPQPPKKKNGVKTTVKKEDKKGKPEKAPESEEDSKPEPEPEPEPDPPVEGDGEGAGDEDEHLF